MEDDKKKKKNKRKKNKQQQNKAATSVDDDATSYNAGETSSVGTVTGERENDDNESNVAIDDKDVHNVNGSVSVDSGKQNWLQEEAKLRDMVKQLLYEKDSHLRRQADLEMRIQLLQTGNESWHQKELNLEERISQLLQENTVLTSDKRYLLENFQYVENEKVSLVEKENLSKDMIETLSNENTRLKMQVLELQGARDNLAHENKLLQDNISVLQSRVQDLETSLSTIGSPADDQKAEKDNLNAQLEEAYGLIGKLITENAELVEKVNELYMELGPRTVLPDVTSVDMPDNSTADLESRPTKDIQEDLSLSAKSVHFGATPAGDERLVTVETSSDYANVVQHFSEATVSGEIVQIPLDENESQDLESQASVSAEDESVPLADAPLIGAPFRLISFFASYVSGADLVDKGSSNSLQ